MTQTLEQDLAYKLSGREALIALLAVREHAFAANTIDSPEKKASRDALKTKRITQISMAMERAMPELLMPAVESIKAQEDKATRFILCMGFLRLAEQAYEHLEAAAYSVMNAPKKTYSEAEIQKIVGAFRMTNEAYKAYFAVVSSLS